MLSLLLAPPRTQRTPLFLYMEAFDAVRSHFAIPKTDEETLCIPQMPFAHALQGVFPVLGEQVAPRETEHELIPEHILVVRRQHLVRLSLEFLRRHDGLRRGILTHQIAIRRSTGARAELQKEIARVALPRSPLLVQRPIVDDALAEGREQEEAPEFLVGKLQKHEDEV